MSTEHKKRYTLVKGFILTAQSSFVGKSYKVLTLIFLYLLSVLMLGCAVQASHTQVKNAPEQNWKISNIQLQQNENEWRLSGRLIAANSNVVFDGEVLLSILDSQGKLVAQQSVNYQRVKTTLRWKNRGQTVATFSTNLAYFPDGGKVIVEHIETQNTSHL